MRNSIGLGWFVGVLWLAYVIYGTLHKGVFIPMRHHQGGWVLQGTAGWMMAGGSLCVLVELSYLLFAAAPGSTHKDSPTPFKILRWAGTALALGAIFAPGSATVSSFAF